MPAASGAKRVKGKRISRQFLIGSEAWTLDDATRKADTPPDHTKGWRVYVRTPEGQPDITHWLKKVSFKIFHTYTNPLRMRENAPFEIQETGWGGFTVDIRLYFVPEASAKPEYRQHFLQLEPWGSEEQQEQQKKDNLVRSEFMEVVEFNEPTEAMWDILTDDAQFQKGQRGKGGKGKGSKQASQQNDRNTVELLDETTKENPYAKQTEQGVVDLLKKAEAQVEEQIKREKEKEQEIHSKLTNVQQQLAAT